MQCDGCKFIHLSKHLKRYTYDTHKCYINYNLCFTTSSGFGYYYMAFNKIK